MWALFKKKQVAYFTQAEQDQISLAITEAEKRTSGEIRVFVEARCKKAKAISRAAEVFQLLKMDQTDARNGVLVYVAMKDRKLAVFGDEGIHARVGIAFWQQEVDTIIRLFTGEQYVNGIISMVRDIGEALHKHFPYNEKSDENELPNDIVFGE
jgi:uncharacterized membrane protein